ncbi:HIG1 domain-containing protein [Parablastomonas sp. CN1-191]|uniref:HIG1 domain-containing protein n=1 Tax=Parablastomonas sp. CN1-191 TaxID=3400908 RepID=UPI003BF7CE13
MTFVAILLIGGFAVATAAALVRGLIAFFKDAEHIRAHGAAPDTAFGAKQNRMMTQRVLFQGIAILLVVIVAALAS